MSFEAALQLQRHSGVQLPRGIRVLPEFWSTSKAATVRNLKWNAVYGNPGTLEGRRKGGAVSQQRRREQPQRYAGSRVRLRNGIRIPPDGEELAEFIGVVLGDGAISNHQVRITLNGDTDRAYGGYVVDLAQRLFGARVTVGEPKGEKVLCLTMTGRNLVEFLVSKGLHRGNKVKQQVDIPKWILSNDGLARVCVRGKPYRSLGLSFTSHSLPLLRSVHRILCGIGLPAKCDGRRHVSIYKRAGIKRYLEVVGTKNPKHLQRFAE
ncbi:MAG: hypothetical protein HYS14_06825 [Candidatus Rokubacteria bacterium]|nr:hypothetical protein [Candidatus Rokubacteria bacterium]